MKKFKTKHKETKKKREIDIKMIKNRLNWIVKTFRNDETWNGDCHSKIMRGDQRTQRATGNDKHSVSEKCW